MTQEKFMELLDETQQSIQLSQLSQNKLINSIRNLMEELAKTVEKQEEEKKEENAE